MECKGRAIRDGSGRYACPNEACWRKYQTGHYLGTPKCPICGVEMSWPDYRSNPAGPTPTFTIYVDPLTKIHLPHAPERSPFKWSTGPFPTSTPIQLDLPLDPLPETLEVHPAESRSSSIARFASGLQLDDEDLT